MREACHRLSYKLRRLPLMDNGPTALRFTHKRTSLHEDMTTALVDLPERNVRERLCKVCGFATTSIPTGTHCPVGFLHRHHYCCRYPTSIFGHQLTRTRQLLDLQLLSAQNVTASHVIVSDTRREQPSTETHPFLG
jgi:hypothetical protein